jgi:SAM-dependent methyltransferase
VLDLAAGTGKLTRSLLAGGLEVVAVEPQEQLRRLLARHAAGAPVLDGLAEEIPLPDASVAAVTVADAFHWFEHRAALAEIARVLEPEGGLAVLTTVPDWSGASWAHELGELVAALRPQHPHFDGPPWQDSVRAAAGWEEPWEIRVTTAQPADPDRVVDLVASMSWVAAMPEAERAETRERARQIVLAGTTPASMPLHVIIGIARMSERSTAVGR